MIYNDYKKATIIQDSISELSVIRDMLDVDNALSTLPKIYFGLREVYDYKIDDETKKRALIVAKEWLDKRIEELRKDFEEI